MGANRRFRIRDSHRVSSGLYVCPRTGYRFRYEVEAKACAVGDPDLLIQPHSRVRISLKHVANLHNRHGDLISVYGPVLDKRFTAEANECIGATVDGAVDFKEMLPEIVRKNDVKKDSVLTYCAVVRLSNGETLHLYIDQVAQLSESEIRNEMQEQAKASKKPVIRPPCIIGQMPKPDGDTPNNFERGFAEGLGGGVDDDDIDPESIDFDDFDESESVEFDV